MEIHANICTTPVTVTKRQNRKSVCLDTDLPGTQELSFKRECSGTPSSAQKALSTSSSPPQPSESSPSDSIWMSTAAVTKKPKRSGSYALASCSNATPTSRKRSGSYVKKSRSGSNSSLNGIDMEIDTETIVISPVEATSPQPLKKAKKRLKSIDIDTDVARKIITADKKDVNMNDILLEESSKIISGYDQKFGRSTSTDLERNNAICTNGRDSPVHAKPPSYLEKIAEKNDDIVEIKEKQKSAVSPVECPLCFKWIEAERINIHAALCDGETDYSTSTGSKVTDVNITKPSVTNDIDMNITTKTNHECPMCGEEFDEYNINAHASFCNGKHSKQTKMDLIALDDEDDDDDNDLPAVFVSSKKTSSSCSTSTTAKPSSPRPVPTGDFPPSSLSRTEKDMMQCPVCAVEIDKSKIAVHVNVCLDMMGR